MSRDQDYMSPEIKLLIEGGKLFKMLWPELWKFVVVHPADFRGLTVFLGDDANMVVGFRYFNDDGLPMICWGSGPDYFLAMRNVDRRLAQDKGKEDKVKR